MTFRHILILFCAVGISSTFMPWLHYPKPDAVVYGYVSDGIVTGFIFLLILIVSVYNIKKSAFNYVGSGFMALVSLWMGFEAYKKINDIEAEKLNFSTDNPVIALSTAGFEQGIGIYVMGMASVAIFVTIILALLFQAFSPKLVHNEETKPSLGKKEILVLISSLGIVAVLSYFFISGKICAIFSINSSIGGLSATPITSARFVRFIASGSLTAKNANVEVSVLAFIMT